uniref:Obscurin like cytoskeletal adaptor 1b n=1 Tax=Xiphophorus maculatus TaxID=8083 RepID=A0A3B5QHC0_XIPMA
MDVFGGAPRFLAYPRPVVVQSGTDAVLKCQIGGDPRPAVIWERNNEKIDPQGRYRVFEDGNVYNLIITAVTIEDSGQYICKAKNSIGETYAAATLKVEGEAQEMELREENKPRFLIKPLSTRVGRGEDAVFSCKLWGNPRPEVVWEKDGRKLNEIFESMHFSVGYQDGGWFQLKIFKTRAPDGGVYTCKARNEFGEALAGAVLLVDAGPGHEEEGNRNVKMFAVTEGKHAKFRCFVTGKPKPEIIWRKDGRLILSGRRYLLYEDREGYFTLKVLYCKQKDNGVYVCAASNTAGQTLSAVHLSVKEPPVRFKQPLYDLEVWERDLAVLECEVPEDSVPITWYLEDRRLQPGAKYGMEEWGTKRRLTIRDIGVDDDGIYLCEMPDGGRSIAEVAVKGTILRKLPRKVDVLEGENAAFCVEVEKEEMDIHWYKDGIELRETHQTILKSFGRTHILVFVNTMPQDSGLVTFLVGRSKTSSQLRVKAARHCPPSCPVGVQINTERANAALLSWVSAPDSRKNPPSGYVLERQEVGTGSQEWLQCLTTDSATSVEILGDSVPCEADYRFRICSVNKYGKSNNVEFPRTVHLVPVARIQAPLQDALVPEGQDALFTIELSASVIGTWFLNGTQLQDDERYSLRRSRTHQSLRIRGVRDADNGAEITFIAYGIRDSAALYIQVHFLLLEQSPVCLFVEVGNPIVLYCELSDPAAPVHWYKNGVELQTIEGLHIQSEGTMRRIVIQSADFSHSGVYCCDAIDDVISFHNPTDYVSISIAPPVRFSAIPDGERSKSIQAGGPFVLQCELSDPSAQVYWYKDGSKLHPQTGVDVKAEGLWRKLVVHSAEVAHSGLYCCKTKGDAFSAIPEDMKIKLIEAGSPIVLQCVVSDPEAQVCWFKEEMKLISSSGLEIHSVGNTRTLVIQSAEVSHSGVYRCATDDDTVEFQVEIKELCGLMAASFAQPNRNVNDCLLSLALFLSSAQYCPEFPMIALPVTYSTIFDAERGGSLEVGSPLKVECEVAASTAPVCWNKDVKLSEESGQNLLTEGSVRTLAFQSAMPSHAGIYICKTSHDAVQFYVDVKALSEADQKMTVVAGSPIALRCALSDPSGQVSWYKDGRKLLAQSGVAIHEKLRELVIQSAEVRHSGLYSCEATDNHIQFKVDVADFIPTPLKLQYVTFIKHLFIYIFQLILSCEVSRTDGVVQWYKDGTEIQPSINVSMEAEGAKRNLIINSAKLSDTGAYTCRTGDNILIFKDVHLDRDDLILECEVSRANADVEWTRNGEALQPSDRIRIDSYGVVRKFVLSGLQPSDSGEYVCEAIDDKLVTVVENESVTLCAVVSSERANIRWMKDGQLLNKDNIHISSEGKTHKLTINPLQLSDSGEYVCDVSTDEMYFSLLVEGKNNVISLKGKTLTLQCEVNKPKGDVQWLKDGKEMTPSRRCTIRAQGRERSLTIQQLTDKDAGQYVCESTDDRTAANVSIETPRVVEFIAELRNITIREGEDAVFKCVVSPADTTLVWRLNGKDVALNERTAVSCNGLCHMLCISSCLVSESGTVTADAEGLESAAELTVQGELLMSHKQQTMCCGIRCVSVHATLEVEVSQEAAEVQWMRQGILIHPGAKYTLKHRGRTHSLTVHQVAAADRGAYSCETLHDRTQAQLAVERDIPTKLKTQNKVGLIRLKHCKKKHQI